MRNLNSEQFYGQLDEHNKAAHEDLKKVGLHSEVGTFGIHVPLETGHQVWISSPLPGRGDRARNYRMYASHPDSHELHPSEGAVDTGSSSAEGLGEHVKSFMKTPEFHEWAKRAWNDRRDTNHGWERL